MIYNTNFFAQTAYYSINLLVVCHLKIDLLIGLLLILISSLFASCRCSIDYKPISNKSSENSDTTISASARMWQGQYEYLSINIKIKRTDSLFVENIIVTPFLSNGKFYPWFNQFMMYSYYYGDENSLGYKGKYEAGTFWQDYFADTFDKLPIENRRTNKGNSPIIYTAQYNSEKSISFEDFFATIEVVLIDTSGKTVTYKRHFDFHGKKECRFSAH